MSYLLNLCYLLVLVGLFPWIVYSALFKSKYREGWSAKIWGRVPIRQCPQPCVWLHAVSVGEVNLLQAIIDHNYNGPFQFFENTLDNRAGFVEVRLRGLAPNTEGIGASVELTSLRQAEGGETLLRGIRAGGNFLSANLAAAHFGLGRWLGPFLVTVHWPGGDHQSVRITQADRFMFFDEIDLDLLTTNLGFHTSEPIVLDASATGIGGVPLGAGIGWFRQGEGVVAMGPTLNEPAGTLAPGNYDMTVFVIDAPTVTFIDFTLAITP